MRSAEGRTSTWLEDLNLVREGGPPEDLNLVRGERTSTGGRTSTWLGERTSTGRTSTWFGQPEATERTSPRVDLAK